MFLTKDNAIIKEIIAAINDTKKLIQTKECENKGATIPAANHVTEIFPKISEAVLSWPLEKDFMDLL